MPTSRPLPKSLLKKMFLKVLHEHKRPGGRYRNTGWDYTGILRTTMCEYFGIERLNDQEYAEGLRAVYELERDGFIMQDHSQSSHFKVLTDRGRQVVEQSLDDMKLSSVDIDQLLIYPDLRDIVRDDYLAGDYETAIFKAFKLVEETIRARSAQPSTAIGADLVSKAFAPTGCSLHHPDAQTAGEAEGFHLLIRGAIMWFKNPSSHRTISYGDPVETAQVLAFADLILRLVNQAS